jgi:hypothetical protein
MKDQEPELFSSATEAEKAGKATPLVIGLVSGLAGCAVPVGAGVEGVAPMFIGLVVGFFAYKVAGMGQN